MVQQLTFDGSHINGMQANGLHVAGNIAFRGGFHCKGEVQLLGASIDGNVDCQGALLSNPKLKAFSADGADIRGNVFMREAFECDGEIRFSGATIGGDLSCNRARISNPGGRAMIAEGLCVKGAVLFHGSDISGELRFLGASVGFSVEFDGARLSNPNSTALTLEATTIQSALFLRAQTRVEGWINIMSATIGTGVQCHQIAHPADLRLDLRYAKVGTFWDEENSWPLPGNLLLDGFQYERLFERSPLDAESRVRWLGRQPRKGFFPQPYEQLASVLHQMGHDREAREIKIEKNRARGQFAEFPKQDWWWYRFFGRAIGYGYRPWRALAASVTIILFGTIIFATGFSNDLISPSKENAGQVKTSNKITNSKRHFAEDYAVFNPFAYSLESFIPLLRLDQSGNWQPNANRGEAVHLWRASITSGQLLRYYLWAHIILGWILTSLWVAAVTGLVKT